MIKMDTEYNHCVNSDEHLFNILNNVNPLKNLKFYANPDFTNSNCGQLNKQYFININKLNIKPMPINELDPTISIVSSSDYIHFNKGFLRLELINDDPDIINEILKTTIMINCSYGGEVFYTIDIQFNLYLMQLCNMDIKIVDTENFLSTHSDEDIDNLIFTTKNNRNVVNSKYIMDKNTFYLDIPLLDEFYNFGRGIPQFPKSSIEFDIGLPSFLDTMIKSVQIGFEENIIKMENEINKYNISSTELFVPNNELLVHDIVNIPIYVDKDDIIIDLDSFDMKFMFLIIDANDVHQINSVHIGSNDIEFDGITTYEISLDNIVTYTYNDKIIYAYSVDEKCDMNRFCLDQDNNYFSKRYIDSINIKFDNIDKGSIINIMYVNERTLLLINNTICIDDHSKIYT
jgi:hypothetical protein